MTGRALVVTGFVLGLLLSVSQACIAPFECIYIYAERPKLCAPLPAPSVNGGFIINANGGLPQGCACVTGADMAQFMMDPSAPLLDPLWAAIEADAKAQCEQLAIENGEDPSPCSSAMIDKQSALTTDTPFDECKELVATIDEDRDGYCPIPGETGDTGETGESEETGGDATDSGSPVPDLGLGMP